MSIKLRDVTARYAVLEIDDGGDYYTKEPYFIQIGGKERISTNKSLNYISGLKPETEYVIRLENEKGDLVEGVRFTTKKESITLNIKSLGAFGDGVHDDTVFIQAAIMACPADGRVLIPAGKYCISNVFLRSSLNLEIQKDAELISARDRNLHPYYPGELQTYDESDEYYLGTWEGNPRPMFAGVICGLGVENVNIYGEGIVNGNATKEDWWFEPKKMRKAYRPRTVFLKDCRNVTIAGITVMNSPSWTIHPFYSEGIRLFALNLINPKDSPNTDGIDPESCRDVEISGVRFSLGDDCIAVKSGKIFMARKCGRPSEKIVISRCLMEDGHGAVTLGSEIAGGVKDLLVKDCFFKNTDRGLRIKTRRGRGKDSVLDGIVFENIRMEKVKTPFTVNSFYFCDPDGKTEYVQSREAFPVDDNTPKIGRLYFKNIEARDCSVAAMYCDGLPEEKIEEIRLEDIRISFDENADKPDVPIMSSGVIPCCRKGIYARNVKKFEMINVQIEGCEGEEAIFEQVDELIGNQVPGERE